MKNKFSSHICVGGRYMSSPGTTERRCVFFNVCHRSGGKDEILYYVDPTQVRQPIFSENNTFFYDFSDLFLSLGNWPWSQKWGPTIINGSVPFGLFENASTALFLESHCECNPGHFLDFAHTIYSLPIILGFDYSKNVQVLTNKRSIPCKKHRNALLPALTNYRIRFLNSEGDVCYRRLFVGAGNLHASGGGAGSILTMTVPQLQRIFLSHIKNNTDDRGAFKRIRRHHVVVLQKNRKINTLYGKGESEGSANNWNMFINHFELVEVLSELLKPYATVESLLPDNLSWNDQVEVIQRATVIITPPGGGSFFSLFAREGASIIVADRNYNGRSERLHTEYQSDWQLWTLMESYFSFIPYPVCSPYEEFNNHIRVVPHRMLLLVKMAMLLAEKRPITQNISSAFRCNKWWRIYSNSSLTKHSGALSMPNVCSLISLYTRKKPIASNSSTFTLNSTLALSIVHL